MRENPTAQTKLRVKKKKKPMRRRREDRKRGGDFRWGSFGRREGERVKEGLDSLKKRMVGKADTNVQAKKLEKG